MPGKTTPRSAISGRTSGGGGPAIDIVAFRGISGRRRRAPGSRTSTDHRSRSVTSPTSDVPNRPLAAEPGPLPAAAPDPAVKVAAATATFWVIKVLTTGMGETASDFLARTPVPELAVGLTGLTLAALLVAQILAPRHRPWLYWAAVAMVSVF